MVKKMNTEYQDKTNEELVGILDSLHMAIPEDLRQAVSEIVEIERELTLRGS